MIKIYEEYLDDKFRYEMLSIDKIEKLSDAIINFFKNIDLRELTFNFFQPHIDFFRIDFYKEGRLKDAKYMCCGVSFTLTTGMVSGKHGVTIDLSVVNFSYDNERYMNICLEFLNFLANVFNNGEVDKYNGYSENFDIDKIYFFIKDIDVEKYNIWKETKKYNL